MTEYTQEEFDSELHKILQEARSKGLPLCRVVSTYLHDEVVREPQVNRMSTACKAMWRLWEKQGSREDRVVHTAPNRQSSVITIEFDTDLNGSFNLLREKIDLPKEVKEAAESGNLVFFIGAGISRLLGLPSWEELAKKSLWKLRDKNIFNHAKIKQIESLNPKQILSISQIASETNFKEELAEHLRESESEPSSIYETIRNIGCVCVTTNYDELLIPKSERIYLREKILPYRLNELGTIIHLHGCTEKPETMIVTTKDYLGNYNNPRITYFLKYLFEEKTVVFLGYGLEEDEILEHILRRGEAQRSNAKHFYVKNFSKEESHLYEGLCKYYEETFGINLLGFLQDGENYGVIESIIKDWARQMKIEPPSLYEDTRFILDKVSDMPVEDILPRIEKEPELCSLFFSKVEGLKWFTPLQQKGYFNPEKLLSCGAKEYLIKTAVKLEWLNLKGKIKTVAELDSPDLEENKSYQKNILSIIEEVTKYAKEKEYSDHLLWRRFAEILFHIPQEFMSDKTVDAVDYWLENEFDSVLVPKIIGEKVLPKLFDKQDDHASCIANKLLPKLFQVSFKPCPFATSETGQKAFLRFKDYWAQKIIEATALKSGERLGSEGVTVFHNELTRVLKEVKRDRHSYVWQPAIEDHEQNFLHNDAENFLVLAYRDSLTGFIQTSPEEAQEYLQGMLGNEYTTIQRIAVHCIGKKGKSYKIFWDDIINEKFFYYNYQHEIWHFLESNYPFFTDKQKEKTLKIIQEKKQKNKEAPIESGKRCMDEKQVFTIIVGLWNKLCSKISFLRGLKNRNWERDAYEQSIWLAAIKDHSKREATLYQRQIKITGVEPKHPDFSFYMSSGGGRIVHAISPYTKEELNSMEIPVLEKELKSFKGDGGWEKPNVHGLSQNFKEAVVSNPLRYFKNLQKLRGIDLRYVYSIISAYSDIWREKTELPWDDIWFHLLRYILEIIGQKEFWDTDSNDSNSRNEMVKAIGMLIEDGARSDEHAFHERHHDKVKDILKNLLENQKSVSFTEYADVDAMTVAINSGRGRCVEALIIVSLRHCRLADKKNNKNHAKAWREFERYFDTELNRNIDINYEFFTLLPAYIPNFLYMSKEWLMKNLENIFDQKDERKWRYAMQGYSHMDGFTPEVYQYLKLHGHIIRALDDNDLSNRLTTRFVQDIVYSFLRKEELLDEEDGLIRILLSRGKTDEIREIILTIYYLRQEHRKKFVPKIYELWPHIQESIKENIDFSSEDGCNLLRTLCLWTEFIEWFDDEKKNWLLEIAPHLCSGYDFSNELFKELARISKRQPFEVSEILLEIIAGMSKVNYGFTACKEEIKTILENLVSKGQEGIRVAMKIVDECARKGVYQPAEILSSIMNERE